MIELLVLEDGEQEGRDREPRKSAVADHPAEHVTTEIDLLGPTAARPESERAVLLAPAVAGHWWRRSRIRLPRALAAIASTARRRS